MSIITINGIAINTAAPAATLMSLGLSNSTAKNSDYLVVQTKAPLDQAQRKALEKTGAKILEAVPGNAYVCHFPKTSLTAVRALKFVTWADLFPNAVKISPGLRNLPPVTGGVALSDVALVTPSELDATSKTVDVVLHRSVNAKKVAKKIAEAAHLTLDQVIVAGQKIRLPIKMRRLGAVQNLFPRLRIWCIKCPTIREGRAHGCGHGSSVWVCVLPRWRRCQRGRRSSADQSVAEPDG